LGAGDGGPKPDDRIKTVTLGTDFDTNSHAPTALTYRCTALTYDSAASAVVHIRVDIDTIVTAEHLTSPAGTSHASAVHAPIPDAAYYTALTAITYVVAKIDANA
jgi:hypothetical protein